MSLTSRVGLFFTLIGIFLIGLYLASDAARMNQCGLLMWGAVVTAVGIILWRKGSPPTESSKRFGTLKRMMATNKKKKEKAKKSEKGENETDASR
jgi:hypothetical protein